MSGTWKRGQSTNFESFIGAQGAGFVQRKLAASMNLVHSISLDTAGGKVRIVEKGSGPIDFDNTYTIGGTPVRTQVS